ncbi:MAG: BlaI/MecI/CopY family transcriptional regulator [Crocinitomicaceae bacterium]|nr:BlaI/MecI/CopY family transcriptional regulator [Crocinitomicaceae bacterium]
MNELTKAEEQVMQVLWEIKEGFVKDIVAKFPNPKPAYNMVSTIIRIHYCPIKLFEKREIL